MKLCSERIQEVNPITNSVVDTRFEKALEEARAVDEEIRNGTVSLETLKEKKPLLGLPFTMKESVAAEGKNYSCIRSSRSEVIFSQLTFGKSTFIHRFQSTNRWGGVPGEV